MGKTSIEWCDHTVNPIRARSMLTGATGHHCVKISPGCTNCYASRWQLRRRMPIFEKQVAELIPKRGGSVAAIRNPNVEVYIDRKALRSVLTRRIPTVYFWCDMTDIFGSWVSDSWLDEIFAHMLLSPQHTHLVLTKRIDRAFRYFTGHAAAGNHIFQAAQKVVMPKNAKKPGVPAWPWKHIKLGVSVEDQPTADRRIPTLLVTPAGGHFVSIEPQLSAITIKWAACSCDDKKTAFSNGHLPHCVLAKRPKGFLDQVIPGGESGPRSRPYNLQWPRSIIRQGRDLDIPVFHKQLGSFPTMTPIGTREFEEASHGPKPPKIVRLKLKSRKGGDMAEWPDDLRVREAMK